MIKFRTSRGRLRIRCYAVREDQVWTAICLPFNLGCQANTLEEAKAALEAQIIEYVEDAFGQDRRHRAYLLSRRAPLGHWLTYWKIRITARLSGLSEARKARAQSFDEDLPLPVTCG